MYVDYYFILLISGTITLEKVMSSRLIFSSLLTYTIHSLNLAVFRG